MTIVVVLIAAVIVVGIFVLTRNNDVVGRGTGSSSGAEDSPGARLNTDNDSGPIA